MAQDRNRRRFQPESPALERRELMTRSVPVHAAAVGPVVTGPEVFHKQFVQALNRRLSISASQTNYVHEAFQVFKQDYATLPAGAARGPALDKLLGQLDGYLANALTRYQLTTVKVGPSILRGPKFSPQAQQILVPVAHAQVQKLGAALAGGPADPTPALNSAYNVIMYALAEYSVRPTLFRQPSDFYVDPTSSFTIDFNGTPASGAPGVFRRGPGGVPL